MRVLLVIGISFWLFSNPMNPASNRSPISSTDPRGELAHPCGSVAVLVGIAQWAATSLAEQPAPIDFRRGPRRRSASSAPAASGIVACPGAERSRDPLRLLREGLAGRRQLALRKRQRDVVGLPLAAHQHLAAGDGLQDLPDARPLPGLPGPLPDGRLLRRIRRPLRAAGEDPLPHRGAQRRAGRRRVGGDRRGRRRRAARPTATGPSWSPTATTGTRAGPSRLPRRRGVQRRADPRPPLPRAGRPARQAGPGPGDRQLGHRHRGRVLADRRRDLHLDAPRRLRDPQVHQRQADRRALQPDHLDAAARGPALLRRSGARRRRRRHDRLRPAEARPQAVRGAPDRLLGAAAAARPRRHQGEAQHRPLQRRPHGPLRRRQRRGDRPRRLLHRLQDHLPLLRRGRLRRSRQPPAALPARRLRRSARASTSSASSSRSGPIMPLAEAQAEWVADLLGARATLPAAAEMRREIAAEEAKMRKRFVASKRHTVEVDFYPYLREIRRERKQAAQRV